jgi:NAD(P)-dependent dehydrogenase (short-subunit alcohol dehydrogenase family)
MILDAFKLTGKAAIVTGAGRGIRRATAIAFARRLAQPEEIAAAALFLASPPGASSQARCSTSTAGRSRATGRSRSPNGLAES